MANFIYTCDKAPRMTPEDFKNSASERLDDARALKNTQTANPAANHWIMINFLSVIAAECMLTAYYLRENDTHRVLASHNIDKVGKRTSFKNIPSVSTAAEKIHNNFKNWETDLRYLDSSYFARRVSNKYQRAASTPTAETIANEMFYAAEVIVKEGEKIWT